MGLYIKDISKLKDKVFKNGLDSGIEDIKFYKSLNHERYYAYSASNRVLLIQDSNSSLSLNLDSDVSTFNNDLYSINLEDFEIEFLLIMYREKEFFVIKNISNILYKEKESKFTRFKYNLSKVDYIFGNLLLHSKEVASLISESGEILDDDEEYEEYGYDIESYFDYKSLEEYMSEIIIPENLDSLKTTEEWDCYDLMYYYICKFIKSREKKENFLEYISTVELDYINEDVVEIISDKLASMHLKYELYRKRTISNLLSSGFGNRFTINKFFKSAAYSLRYWDKDLIPDKTNLVDGKYVKASLSQVMDFVFIVKDLYNAEKMDIAVLGWCKAVYELYNNPASYNRIVVNYVK